MSASDSMQHGPAAIWQYLKPILSEISMTYPSVDCVHFFSDGPCSQYRQKGNFYLLSENIFSMGFTKSTLNFHEAGHGKGIPDGIGGTMKRIADCRVRYGTDIMTANQFVDTLRQETKIKLFVVEISEGQSEKLIKKSLKAVPGTMALHQIVITEQDTFVTEMSAAHAQKIKPFKEFSFENKDTMQPKLRKEDAMKLEQPVDSSENFNSLIDRLQACKNFSELKELCQNLNLESITGHQRSILGEKLDVYHQALDMYPGDVPGSEILFPVYVMMEIVYHLQEASLPVVIRKEPMK
ncbi:hypothetical protein SNE40_000673 [Patella caerulea]|uniref:Uncharacterized protein n=1 Tax=Patella caerulea TaxID=87958 RepID=A0AAN8KCQ5_PATCE